MRLYPFTFNSFFNCCSISSNELLGLAQYLLNPDWLMQNLVCFQNKRAQSSSAKKVNSVPTILLLIVGIFKVPVNLVFMLFISRHPVSRPAYSSTERVTEGVRTGWYQICCNLHSLSTISIWQGRLNVSSISAAARENQPALILSSLSAEDKRPVPVDEPS